MSSIEAIMRHQDPIELKVRPVLAMLARLRAGTVGGDLIGPQGKGEGTSP